MAKIPVGGAKKEDECFWAGPWRWVFLQGSEAWSLKPHSSNTLTSFCGPSQGVWGPWGSELRGVLRKIGGSQGRNKWPFPTHGPAPQECTW